jgi:hypothetical protein
MDAVDQATNAIRERTGIDYLLVADRAEVVNGKLYMMGGGWERLQPAEFPLTMTLGIAVGVRVVYAEAEDVHRVRVVLERSDGPEIFQIEAELTTGRPPGGRGRDLLVPMAFNIPLTIPEPGDLALTASVDGHQPRRHSIRAMLRPGSQPPSGTG